MKANIAFLTEHEVETMEDELVRIVTRLLTEDEIEALPVHVRERVKAVWQGKSTFVNPKTGRRQMCRMDVIQFDDPIMRESGCAGDFARDARAKDRADGCPACIEAMMP